MSLPPNSPYSVITPTSATTDGSGVATFTVTGKMAETVICTAATAGPTVLTATATVDFIQLTADETRSTVSAEPTAVPADGTATATITVTLRTVDGVTVSGKGATLTASGVSSTIPPPSGPSDINGVVTFTVKDTIVEGPLTYTATDETDGVTVTQTVQVTFTAIPDPSASTVTADPTTVVADAVATATITVTVAKAGGARIPGLSVSMAANGGNSSTISPVAATTDGSGVATFTVSDSAPEGVTYTATAGDVPIEQTAQVTFTAPPSGGGGTGRGGTAAAPSSRTTTSAPTTAGTVGSAGSTLTTTDGMFTLTMPAGALTGNATLAVTEATGAPAGLPQGLTAASPTFTLTGATLGTPQRVSPGRLSVYAMNSDGTWTLLPTTVNAAR